MNSFGLPGNFWGLCLDFCGKTEKQKDDESGIRTHALSDQIAQGDPSSGTIALVWRLRPLGHLTLWPEVQNKIIVCHMVLVTTSRLPRLASLNSVAVEDLLLSP